METPGQGAKLSVFNSWCQIKRVLNCLGSQQFKYVAIYLKVSGDVQGKFGKASLKIFFFFFFLGGGQLREHLVFSSLSFYKLFSHYLSPNIFPLCLLHIYSLFSKKISYFVPISLFPSQLCLHDLLFSHRVLKIVFRCASIS